MAITTESPAEPTVEPVKPARRKPKAAAAPSAEVQAAASVPPGKAGASRKAKGEKAEPAAKTPAKAAAKRTSPAAAEAAAAAPEQPADLSDEIALQAYFIWLEEGRPHGASMEHWLRAETLVRTRRDVDSVAA
ncbi:DUF2934 domain-containing protein [Oleisolibacter albus]|uniref:DUF2934 domain-containing protein n=1 Tax=Oleisolibacter albus TaxID=2171757 RepID=UPI000DF30A82|nr:DUF2934 domain-containing protein [Oleisolibacter albus]